MDRKRVVVGDLTVDALVADDVEVPVVPDRRVGHEPRGPSRGATKAMWGARTGRRRRSRVTPRVRWS